MAIMAATVSKSLSRLRSLSIRQKRLRGALSIALATWTFPVAQAAEWRFTPYVGGSATYTDNANQSANDPEDALILSVSPGFSLNSVGSRRVQASMNYSLSAVSRFGDDTSTDVYHNLGAAGKAELIEDFFFIDGTASISQGLISLVGSSADAITNDANRTAVGVYSISPYIQKRFGSFATGQARYTTGGAIFGKNSASDSVTNAFTASLNSGPRFNDLSWGVDYSIYYSDNSGTPNTTFERASVRLGYALTRKFRIFGTYGEEWNEYLSASSVSGSSYSVGFGWSPSRRTSIEASVGERYFGRTYSFSASHQARASNWYVRYSEDVSDITQQFLRDSGRIFWECSNRLVETRDFTPPSPTCNGPYTSAQFSQAFSSLGVPLSDLIAAGLVDVAVANGVYVIKNFTAGVSWSKARLGWGLSIFDTKRIFQALTGTEDRSQGVTTTLSYRVAPRTNANSTLALARNTSTTSLAPTREDKTLSLSLGLTHEFGKDLSGALSFRHTQRDSNTANSDYTENSLTASANLRF